MDRNDVRTQNEFFNRKRVGSQCIRTLLLKKAVEVNAAAVEAAMDTSLQLEKRERKFLLTGGEMMLRDMEKAASVG